MLLSLAALGAPSSALQDADGLEPGISTLVLRAVSALRRSMATRHDDQVANLIADNGGHLTDDVERRIAQGFMTGRF